MKLGQHFQFIVGLHCLDICVVVENSLQLIAEDLLKILFADWQADYLEMLEIIQKKPTSSEEALYEYYTIYELNRAFSPNESPFSIVLIFLSPSITSTDPCLIINIYVPESPLFAITAPLLK